LLLAVPLAACVGVLVRFAVRRYKESPLFLSERPSTGSTVTMGPAGAALPDTTPPSVSARTDEAVQP